MNHSPFLLASEFLCGNGIKTHLIDYCQVTTFSGVQRLFVAITDTSIIFIHRTFSRILVKGEIDYYHIRQIDHEIDNETDLKITLKPNTKKVSDIFIQSGNRYELSTLLQTAWRADRLSRTCRIQKIRIGGGKFSLKPFLHGATRKILPFSEYAEFSLYGYRWFLPSNFKESKGSWIIQSGVYENPSKVKITICFGNEIPIEELSLSEFENLPNLATQTLRTIQKEDPSTLVLSSTTFLKSMNLNEDPASWEGHQLILDTKMSMYCLTILRRKFIPPVFEKSKTFLFKIELSKSRAEELEITFSDILSIANICCNTFHSNETDIFWFPKIVQAKLDALCFVEDAYLFLENFLGMFPRCYRKARAVVKSLLAFLSKANVLQDEALLFSLENTQVDKIINSVNTLVTSAEGFDIEDDFNEIREAAKNHWQARCASYIAFCIQNILKGRLSIIDLCDASYQSITKQEFEELTIFLEFLLHLRPRDWNVPYSQGNFVEKFLKSSSDNVSDEWIFNEKVLSEFFACGYVASMIEPGDEWKYIEVLRLLLNSVTSVQLKSSVLWTIIGVTEVCHEEEDPKTLEYWLPIIPSLLDLLDLESPLYVHSIAALAASALLNLSFLNAEAKQKMISNGAPDILIGYLRYPNEDLEMRINILKLCQNLTKIDDHITLFNSLGLMSCLADILAKFATQRYPIQRRILTHTTAIIGQLAGHEATRDDLIHSLPALDILLFLFHDECLLFTNSNPELRNVVSFFHDIQFYI
eukprot:GHVP01034134.1.p1 GENE.GHVP01034134.1~~GHVP01034134.1.p1  ORF type:complete len:756 (-),score=96.68 GHVP01034134.1:239-2506(-)